MMPKNTLNIKTEKRTLNDKQEIYMPLSTNEVNERPKTER